MKVINDCRPWNDRFYILTAAQEGDKVGQLFLLLWVWVFLKGNRGDNCARHGYVNVCCFRPKNKENMCFLCINDMRNGFC